MLIGSSVRLSRDHVGPTKDSLHDAMYFMTYVELYNYEFMNCISFVSNIYVLYSV